MICPDASVAVKWLAIENDYLLARSLLADAEARREPMIAPHLLHSEVTNSIRQMLRRGAVTIDSARSLLQRFERERIAYLSPPGLHDRALVLTHRFDFGAVYDAHYLALCEITGATFWTANERLYNNVAGALPFVRRLADYQPR